MAQIDHHDALVKALTSGYPPLGKPEAILSFYPGQYLFSWHDGGSVRQKLLAGASVRAAFDEEPVDSDWLPAGTVRWGQDLGGTYLVRWIPPGLHRLPFVLQGSAATVVLTVPLPGLVWAGHGHKYRVWATLTDAFSPDAPAYLPPLPNVYGDGSICFGPGNAPPAISAATAGAAWGIFCGAPFNSHLAGGKSHAFPNDVRPMMQQLDERKATVYPPADLMPLRNATNTPDTIARLMARMLREGAR